MFLYIYYHKYMLYIFFRFDKEWKKEREKMHEEQLSEYHQRRIPEHR